MRHLVGRVSAPGVRQTIMAFSFRALPPWGPVYSAIKKVCHCEFETGKKWIGKRLASSQDLF